MRFDAASKIEAARWRSRNEKIEFYPRHMKWLQPMPELSRERVKEKRVQSMAQL